MPSSLRARDPKTRARGPTGLCHRLLGYGAEGKRYERTYASVRASTAPEERADYDWLISLHRLLPRHGKEVCRRKQPECTKCPLIRECPYYMEHFEV